MLSIRKVLEDSGIIINVYTWEDRWRIDIGNPINIKKDNIIKTKEHAIEQACRQYIKENGFKLEWFSKRTISYYKDDIRWHKEEKDLGWFSELAFDQLEETKLIAWLYANDIEIKEGNNER